MHSVHCTLQQHYQQLRSLNNFNFTGRKLEQCNCRRLPESTGKSTVHIVIIYSQILKCSISIKVVRGENFIVNCVKRIQNRDRGVVAQNTKMPNLYIFHRLHPIETTTRLWFQNLSTQQSQFVYFFYYD